MWKPKRFVPIVADADRFWALAHKGEPDECWGFGGDADKKYPAFWYYDPVRMERVCGMAHKFSFMMHSGYSVSKGLMVLHTCDNPNCVNPSHLWLGTHEDNMQDMADKDRGVYPACIGLPGADNNAAKLTNDRAIQCRVDYATGQFTQRELADREGTSDACMSKLLRGETWSHVGGPLIPDDKGGSKAGVNNGRAKGNDEIVREVRRLIPANAVTKEKCTKAAKHIKKKYGVSISWDAVADIARFRTWKHVK